MDSSKQHLAVETAVMDEPVPELAEQIVAPAAEMEESEVEAGGHGGHQAALWHPGQEPPLAAQVEAILFVADRPVTYSELMRSLDATRAMVDRALAELDEACATRGLRLQRNGGKMQLVSAPAAAPAIQRFLGLEDSSRLSRAALEALSIIAYRQPVTRPEIEALRGVNSDGVMRTLLSRGLVEPVGQRDTVGLPIEYGTTFRFLEYFGIGSLDELPPLEAVAEAPAPLDLDADEADAGDVDAAAAELDARAPEAPAEAEDTPSADAAVDG